MEKTNFEKLAAINVNDKIEKKRNLSYLSWAWAVDQLLRADSNATWSYGEPKLWGETVMVFCTVIAFGKPMTAQLPVMDHMNKAIKNPDAFSVNTAMQRCLAKAIALHGLGLYIYAGEDVPEESGAISAVKETAKEAAKFVSEERKDELTEIALEMINAFNNNKGVQALKMSRTVIDNEEKMVLWELLASESQLRSFLKANKDTQ